uniref:E-selectin n=1 Tax=Magallana gigas TaxID=29159 RepID=K1QRM2_MAGGI
MDKLTGSKVSFMLEYPELGRLDNLDVYTDEIPDVRSSCSNLNGLCSTFCFPTPNGRTCGCQDNVKLQSDQLTCEGAIVCPLSLGNAVLSSSCSRRAGDSCTFSCSDGYIPTTSERLMCTSDGTWNLDTDTLCTPIKCPLDVTNGHVSSSCRGMIGENCDVSCGDDASMNIAHIICLSSGAWDKDPAVICRLHHESEKSLSYHEIGLCVLCVIVFTVVIATSVTCWYSRKGNAKKND